MNLIERAKSILLQPKDTWVTIEAESTDAATLYTRYAMIWPPFRQSAVSLACR